MTTLDAKIQIVDHGFLHPRGQLSRDSLEVNEFHHVGVDALPQTVQFVRATVVLQSTGQPSDHLVIWGHFPRMTDDQVATSDAAIRSAFPGMSVTFVLSVELLGDSELKTANIEARDTDPTTDFRSVCAVCAAECWGTLADIEAVTVRMADVSYRATMQSSANGWLASAAVVTRA
jgi:hypothetical protein